MTCSSETYFRRLIDRQEVNGKSRGLQWKKKLSEFENHDVYPIYCSKFTNITKNHSKSSRSIVRLSSNMIFCRKNLIKNEGITNEFRKPSYEAANRLVTRATQDSNVGYCVGNSNLVSEIFQHEAEKSQSQKSTRASRTQWNQTRK